MGGSYLTLGQGGIPKVRLAGQRSIWNHSAPMNLKKRLATLLFAFVSFAFAGSAFADSHEAIVDDAIKQMERMTTALVSVTDKATAEKAVVELKGVGAELKKVAERAKAAGKPTDEVKTKLEAKMKAKEKELEAKMAGLQGSLEKAGVEAATILMKGMEELGPILEEVGKTFEEADEK